MTYGYTNGSVEVGTTATLIFASPQQNSFVVVKNRGPETVYLGGLPNPEGTVTADESSTGGLPLEAGETITVPTWAADTRDLFGITASDTAIVSWLGMS